MNRIKSLRLKFALAMIGLLLLVVAVQLSFSLIRTLPQEKQEMTNHAQVTAALAVEPIVTAYTTYSGTVGSRLVTAMRPLAKQLMTIEYFQIIDMKGEVLYDSRSLKHSVPAETLTDPTVLAAVQSRESSVLPGKDGALVFPYFDAEGNHPYSVRFFVNYSQLAGLGRSLFVQSAFLFFFFAAVGTVFMFMIVQRWILVPIDQLRSDSNALLTGNYGHTFNVTAKDEFHSLVQNLNTMTKALTDSLKGLEEEKAWKNEFLVLASHNLRTPLTVIMTSVAALRKDAALSAESKKFVDFIYMRGKELHTLIENLLSISMLKDNKPKVTREPFDLMEVLTAIAKDQEARLRQRNLTLEIHSKADKVPFNGDEGQLFQVIDNVVDNAIKFTREGGKIVVTLTDTPQVITLSIKDNGAGIDEKMVSKLFDSFRRGASPMSVDNKGAGLGLYFVKLAIEAHGGEVNIKSKQGEGTEVIFTLPKAS